MMNPNIITQPCGRIKHFIVFHMNKFQKFSTRECYHPYAYNNFTELPFSFVINSIFLLKFFKILF